MRWWLAAVFVAIATLTAAMIAAVSSRQADRELRANAENIALGAGISARSAVEQAIIDGNLAEQLPSIGARHNVALFVFSEKRRLIASGHYKQVHWADVPEGGPAVLTALGGRRLVAAFHGGRSTLVALPLDRRQGAAVLVACAEAAVRPVARDLPPRRRAGVDLRRPDRRGDGFARRDPDLAAAASDGQDRRGNRAGRVRPGARARAPRRDRRARGHDRPDAAPSRRRVRAAERGARPARAPVRAATGRRARGRPPAPRPVRERTRQGAARRRSAREGGPASRHTRRTAASPRRGRPVRARSPGRRGAQPAEDDGATISLVGVPASSSDLVVLVSRRHHRAGAAPPGRARVRHQRVARAAHPGDRDRERGRGAEVRRAGRRPRAGSASST